MKRLIIAILCMSGFGAHAAEVPERVVPDTVKVIDKADKVIVSRKGDATLIEVEQYSTFGKDVFSYNVVVEDDDSDATIDFEFPFGIGQKDDDSKRADKRLRTSLLVLDNIYIGHRFNYSDKGNVKNYYEGGFRNLVGMRWSIGYSGPSFSIGLGFGFHYYGAQDGFVYTKEGSCLRLVPVEEGRSVKWSMLSVFNFQVPLLFSTPIGKDLKFTAGVVGCFNSYAQVRTELLVGNSKYKTIYKGLQQRLFTAEATCSLGVCEILGVYASWSPMTLFQAPYGPELKSWSIGAVVNF